METCYHWIFLLWAYPGLVYRLFKTFSHSNIIYNFNNKKRRWCAWDLNPGPQYGRRRPNHANFLPLL